MTMLMIFIIYLFINTYNVKHNIKEHNKSGSIFYQSEFVFRYYFLEFALVLFHIYTSKDLPF